MESVFFEEINICCMEKIHNYYNRKGINKEDQNGKQISDGWTIQGVQVGQLPAHSDHPIYQDTEEATEGRSSLVQSLDGTWEFAYSVNAKAAGGFLPRENAAGYRIRSDPCAGAY